MMQDTRSLPDGDKDNVQGGRQTPLEPNPKLEFQGTLVQDNLALYFTACYALTRAMNYTQLWWHPWRMHGAGRYTRTTRPKRNADKLCCCLAVSKWCSVCRTEIPLLTSTGWSTADRYLNRYCELQRPFKTHLWVSGGSQSDKEACETGYFAPDNRIAAEKVWYFCMCSCRVRWGQLRQAG